MHSLTVAGHQIVAWSLGVAAITIFQDQGPGLTRDHPPLERRVTGALTGPLALLSLLMLAVDNHDTLWFLILAPFAFMASYYSWAWWNGWRADRRRRIGWQTGVIGLAALLVLMLIAGPEDWHGGVVIASYAGTAALLGGLTCLITRAFLGVRPDDVEDATSPYGVPARVVAFGMGIAGLAALDGLAWAILSHKAWVPMMACWFCLSLVIPAGLMALGHGLYPRVQRYVWTAAFLSAAGGQAAIHTVTLFFPGLMPPAAI